MGDGDTENPTPSRPVGLSMADLLRLADAFPLLDRLVLLVTVRAGGDRETIIFGILAELQDHLDSTAPPDRLRSVQEMNEALRGWFEGRIAEEEALVAEPGAPRRRGQT